MIKMGEYCNCIKQPEKFQRKKYPSFIGHSFQCINTYKCCLPTDPPKYITEILLHCEELGQYIVVDSGEFYECFKMYEKESIIKENKEMDKVKQHKELCDKLNDTYKQKNSKYESQPN